MGTLRFLEKRLADRQTAFFHRTVKVEQGFAQLIDRMQIGQVRTFAEGGQFIQQRTEFLAFARVLLPALQQAFGVQQDVHALGQKVVDQLRVALDAQPCARGVRQAGQTFGQQCLGALDQGHSVRDPGQRVRLELAQAEAEQTFGFQQQFDFVQIQGDLVGLVFPGQLIQRRGQLGNRQHPGHRRTALEGVQGALQLIAGLQRHVFGRLIQEAVEAVQMGFGFFAEDLQQQGIKGRDVLGIFIGGPFLALGQGMGAGGQLVDVVALALCTGGKFGHQFRQQRHHISQQLLHGSARCDAVLQHAVEQVFHGPGQFAEHQRTDHSTTALQRVERATHVPQG